MERKKQENVRRG